MTPEPDLSRSAPHGSSAESATSGTGGAAQEPSLRKQLTWLILLAVVAVALVQTAVIYRTARSEAEAVFDAQMERVALSLTGSLAAAVIGNSPLDEDGRMQEFIIQVWRADGTMLYRSPSARLLPPQAVLGFSTARVGGTDYRVYSLQTPLQVVQVAQATASRRAMAGQLALRSILPVLALAPLLMLLVWWVIARAMAPVERVRTQMAMRQPDDLAPLPREGVPAELQPLIVEMNGLLSRLGAAWDALQQFTADAAHELRSPLAALRLQAQSLQRAEDPHARRVATGRLLSGIDRATRLIEQLLDLARMEGKDGQAVPGPPVNLTALAAAVVQEQQQDACSRDIDLTLNPVNGHAADQWIKGHADALEVLLRNLLENALRHTPAGGRIRVQVTGEADATGPSRASVLLTVEDSGPGIPVSERLRVLDRFYRVPGTSGHGSGIGLAIVSAIARRHGAALRLDDSPELGGLRITMVFPPKD